MNKLSESSEGLFSERKVLSSLLTVGPEELQARSRDMHLCPFPPTHPVTPPFLCFYSFSGIPHLPRLSAKHLSPAPEWGESGCNKGSELQWRQVYSFIPDNSQWEWRSHAQQTHWLKLTHTHRLYTITTTGHAGLHWNHWHEWGRTQ